MIIVGLTGGIASGKSFVVNYLKKRKFKTHESDLIVGALYKKPPIEFINYLEKKGFKGLVYKKTIDKKIIRNEIFNNSKKRNDLEKYLHKKVQISRNIFLKKNKKKEVVFLDIPLLFEKKLQLKCDYVCSVIAPTLIRQRRAIKRKGMTIKIFNQIVKHQVLDKIRIKKSDYIINTSLSKKKTCIQIEKIIYDIVKNRKKTK